MTSETPSKPTKLCPTCGTRVSEDATRCLVCGSDLRPSDKPGKRTKGVQGSRMPEITLSLPAVLGLLSLFLAIGAGMVFFALRQTGEAEPLPTETPTVTVTLTATITPTPLPPTPTETPLPTATPISYTVRANETCLNIAGSFGVSVQSLIQLNNLGVNCTIYEGQSLQIPQPTATATLLPTSTLSAAEATDQACEKVEYTVQENDTLGSIANAYNVPMAVIQEENGLSSDSVFLGMPLTIPLCKRNPTPGPSPTATLPPPYAAPNLLLPRHGANITEDVVTLQWATVGALNSNEAYAVYILDITDENQPKSVEYVTDTKFIVPESLRPVSSSPHIFEWWVVTVRQTGTDDNGNPVWEAAGAASDRRAFLWSGLPGPAPVPTATP